MSGKSIAAAFAAGVLPLCLAAPAWCLEPQGVWGEGGVGSEETDYTQSYSISTQNPSSQSQNGSSQQAQTFDGLQPGGQYPVQTWTYDPDKGGYVPVDAIQSTPHTYQMTSTHYAGGMTGFPFVPDVFNTNIEQKLEQLVWQGLAENFWGFGGSDDPAASAQDPDVYDNEAVTDSTTASTQTASDTTTDTSSTDTSSADTGTGGSTDTAVDDGGSSGGGGGGGSGFVCVTYNIDDVCIEFGSFP